MKAALQVDPLHIEAYLAHRGWPAPTVVRLAPLGADVQEGLKDYGYGRPLRVIFESAGATHQLVLRTMAPDPFGHDRRSDRAGVLLGAFDTFNGIPHHIRALDVGAFAEDGSLCPMARGEIFLVTDYVDGTLYAHDLRALAGEDAPTAIHRARAEALATYLAELHARPAPPEAWQRDLRDTVGSGEGIAGLCDSYPPGHPVATAERLEAIEHAAVAWRWRLRPRSHRARRTHGDFHPFNSLCRDGTDFSVLDASRGGMGEPADDVTCLALNYLFFALVARGRPDGALRTLFDTFLGTYLSATGDDELLEVVAPFFAWRCLVVANPVWYPQVPDALRDRILSFAERLLAGEAFRPDRMEELL